MINKWEEDSSGYYAGDASDDPIEHRHAIWADNVVLIAQRNIVLIAQHKDDLQTMLQDVTDELEKAGYEWKPEHKHSV